MGKVVDGDPLGAEHRPGRPVHRRHHVAGGHGIAVGRLPRHLDRAEAILVGDKLERELGGRRPGQDPLRLGPKLGPAPLVLGDHQAGRQVALGRVLIEGPGNRGTNVDLAAPHRV
jgi:hypothetical protein